jgi:hypothetical protein
MELRLLAGFLSRAREGRVRGPTVLLGPVLLGLVAGAAVGPLAGAPLQLRG